MWQAWHKKYTQIFHCILYKHALACSSFFCGNIQYGLLYAPNQLSDLSSPKISRLPGFILVSELKLVVNTSSSTEHQQFSPPVSLLLLLRNFLSLGFTLTWCPSLSDDFKPASIDTSCEGELQVGKGDEVTITLPHIPVRLAWNGHIPEDKFCGMLLVWWLMAINLKKTSLCLSDALKRLCKKHKDSQ